MYETDPDIWKNGMYFIKILKHQFLIKRHALCKVKSKFVLLFNQVQCQYLIKYHAMKMCGGVGNMLQLDRRGCRSQIQYG